jgi:eukaryotic-like serine/threonine-protein kinase
MSGEEKKEIANPNPAPSSAQQLSKKARISRRRFLIGGGTAVGIVSVSAGVSLGWLWSRRKSPSTLPQQSSPLYRFKHTDQVTSVAWSPDSTQVVSGSYDYTVKVWDITSRELLTTFQSPQGHTDVVTSVAWSPDGTRVASGSWDKTIKVWNIATGTLIATYSGHTHAVSAVAWSYDSKYIISGSTTGAGHSIPRMIKIWDTTQGGRNILTYQNGVYNIHAIAWSPYNSALVASGTDNDRVYIQNIHTNKTVFTYHRHTDQVNALAWSPTTISGHYIASGSGEYDPDVSPLDPAVGDTTVHVWDVSKGNTPLVYRGHQNSIISIAWSLNGKYIASGSAAPEHNVRVWNAQNGQDVFLYRGHIADVRGIAWSPNGRYIASGSADTWVDIWQVNL